MKMIITFIVDIFINTWYNLANNIYRIGGITIKKLQPKRKKWLEYQNKKKQLRVIKENRLRKNKIQGNRYENKFIATAPNVFSIIDNPEETIEYFNRIIKEIKLRKFGRIFHFDLSLVSSLTIDAVIYIIAILRNIKCTKLYQYRFSGNQPEDKKARQLFKESGFFRYVESNEKNIISNSNKIQITTGNKVDTEVASAICDFVNEICETNLKFTFYLYNGLIELMTNTIQHAYINKGKDIFTVNHWYVFVENQDSTIKFTFLDTGAGIPNTIYKKWGEKIPFLYSDSEFIRSALKGEFRTQTRESNRGKGLPFISECCTIGNFKSLYIYSGSGCCKVLKEQDNPYVLSNVKNQIFGTLFSWEISKKNIIEEYRL